MSKDTHITVTLTDDASIQKLNKKYLGRDYPTDVLSFKIDEQDKGDLYLGDIIVNREQAKRQASEYGNDYEHELAELVAHGILHLLDVHHHDDDEKTVHGVEVK